MENCYHMLLSVSEKVKHSHWDPRPPTPVGLKCPQSIMCLEMKDHREEPAHCPAAER